MAEYYYNPFNNPDNERAAAERFLREQKIKAEKKSLRKIGIGLGLAIIAYIALQTAASLVMTSLGIDKLYNSNPVFQHAFNIIFISTLSVAAPFGIVCLAFRKKYKHPVIPLKPINSFKLIQWVSFGMAACLLSNYAVAILINVVKEVFRRQLTQGELQGPNSPFACVIEIVGLAIIPALCEEFAMRCCSLQLLRNYGKGFAVVAVSTVFGLLHGNVIQFAFAFLIGLVLAYVTIKTDSIVPAICIHACNNGMSALQNILEYAIGDKLAERIVTVLFICWGIAGLISFLILLFKGELKRSSSNDDKSLLTTSDKWLAFMVPGMIIPFIILITLTITTIKPI